jgi:iron-sulfur cluster repair protein YtfE (RIC family)
VAQGIIDALRHDHDEVREMFARLDTATGEQRQELFQQLLSELVRHEVAEEEILRPVSKRDAGEAIANARMKEESQAEELLKEMEKLDPGSDEFTAKLAKLRREVERHAEAEETKEFPGWPRKKPPSGWSKWAEPTRQPRRRHQPGPIRPRRTRQWPTCSPGRSPRWSTGHEMRCGTP